MRIGVLAVQGAFAEHIATLRQLEVDALPIRLPRELEGLEGLVIPGGESTTISKLMLDYDLAEAIIKLAKKGLPLMGTCAGMILLAKQVSDSPIKPLVKKPSDFRVTLLGLMDITVRRNAFGRQRESFEAELNVPVLGENPFPGIFIRAPLIEQVHNGVEILARLKDGAIVAARQGNLLATAFHPELTNDLRFHQYFIDIIKTNSS